MRTHSNKYLLFQLTKNLLSSSWHSTKTISGNTENVKKRNICLEWPRKLKKKRLFWLHSYILSIFPSLWFPLPLSCLFPHIVLGNDFRGVLGTWSCHNFASAAYWPSDGVFNLSSILYPYFLYHFSWNRSAHILSFISIASTMIYGKERRAKCEYECLRGAFIARCNHTYILLNDAYILLLFSQ